MEKKILIVDDDFNEPVKLKIHHKIPDAVIISNKSTVIEINGVQYEEREQQPKAQDSYVHKKLMGIMMISSLFGGLPPVKEYGKVNVDIVKEFELIQNKKSRLSASERRWVVGQFNYHYKKLEQ